jgi:ankyrin repeat protein
MKFSPHATSAKCNRRLIIAVLSLAFLLHVSAPCDLNALQADSLNDKLFVAIENNDIVTVEQLLRGGANVEAVGPNGLTPLMSAAEQGSVPLVSLLLQNGADANKRGDQDETVLSWAARSGRVRVVDLLVRLSDTKNKNHALFAAVEGGPLVIRNDAPAALDSVPTEPADVEESWTATVESLLANGANIEARNEDGSTPLTWASAFAQTDILKLLIQRGAKTNVTDKYGNTALISAACECAEATMNSAYDVVRILLKQGANVNARNHDGRTALMMASGMIGDARVLQLLLDNGADPRAKDHEGKTALRFAREGRRDDKIAILKTATSH